LILNTLQSGLLQKRVVKHVDGWVTFFKKQAHVSGRGKDLRNKTRILIRSFLGYKCCINKLGIIYNAVRQILMNIW